MDTKVKSLLSDLGRATRRGIRKCPKCGIYNGTRGISCKNKNCTFIFKDIGEKRKLCSEAIKLLTGTTTQVYSVRVKDKGPECRGFVQLPYITASLELDPTLNLINQAAALCFVDNCQRLFDTSILKCHESEQTPAASVCFHIQAAIKCTNVATALMLRNSVLSSLNVTNKVKQELWLLATETTGPLVQRLTKNIMVVKCQTSSKHPLGYLHLSFFTTKVKDRTEHKVICSCSDLKDKEDNTSSNIRKCIHYHACICAFASDTSLSEEFSYFVNLEHPFGITFNLSAETNYEADNDDLNDGFGSLFTVDLTTADNECEIEVLTDQGLLDVSQMVVDELKSTQNQPDIQDLALNNDREDNIINDIEHDILNLSQLSNTYSYENTKNIKIAPAKKHRVVKMYPPKKSKIKKTIPNIIKSSKNLAKNQTVAVVSKAPSDDQNLSLSFSQWLASVNEAINETMHYQLKGDPEPLKFIIPQAFFYRLRDRMSFNGSKKRLPNFTKCEIRRDKPPLGIFTKYSWHITNILQIKKIFDSDTIPLNVLQRFTKNQDGTYNYLKETSELTEFKDDFIRIKPSGLRTYLKVGKTSLDQNEPTPFIIEWIADLYPISDMGELVLTFQFGHCQEKTSSVKKEST